MVKRRQLLAAGAASAACNALLDIPCVVSVQGANWPTRGPIKLVPQFPLGGLVDTILACLLGLMIYKPGRAHRT